MLYIYIRTNNWYNQKNLIKIGIFGQAQLSNRNSVYLTGEPDAGRFISIWECNLEKEYDRYLKLMLTEWNYKSTGGTEFYYDTPELHIELSKLFKAQGAKIRKLSQKEIEDFERKNYEAIKGEESSGLSDVDIKRMFESETLSDSSEDDSTDSGISPKEKLRHSVELSRISRLPESIREKAVTTFITRDYQREIIDKLVETLQSPIPRIYLELATGAGKSCITFNVVKRINPDVLFTMSPRKNINKQNMSSKYLSILGNGYLPYNFSEPTEDFKTFKQRCEESGKKMLIVGTSQGANKKIYDTIVENDLKSVFVWFDEAHHTVESWIKKVEDECKVSTKFLLEDTSHISYRLFTSASPDKNHVSSNPGTFGELFSPITVKELISRKWLCPINCRVLEFDKKDFDFINWILDSFENNDRSFGFCFHSRIDNAFSLFINHYELYNNGKTNIKPFLLINNINDLNTSNQKKINSIKLNYDFTSINSFENLEPNSSDTKNIAYLVQMYNMGYDKKYLDYIVIADMKTQYKDIIQSIGRGIRPDKKGPDGTNLYKELLLMLPTYIKEEDTNEYKNIIEVLRYLMLDIEMDIVDILINKIESTESKETNGLDYTGTETNTSKVLDLLYSNSILNRVNTETLNKFCLKYGIKTEQDYYRFKELNPSLNLKSNLYEYPGFYWKNVVDSNSEKYYTSKQECINAKEKIISEAESLEDEKYEELMIDIDDDGWVELNKHDSKIPPYRDLDKFYP